MHRQLGWGCIKVCINERLFLLASNVQKPDGTLDEKERGRSDSCSWVLDTHAKRRALQPALAAAPLQTT